MTEQALIPPSLLRRLAAMLYDSFLLIAILMFATAILMPLTHGEAITPGNHLYQSYIIIIIFCFYAYFWLRKGQTLGMLAWHIRLISTTSSPLKCGQVLLRFLFALLTIPLCGVGLLWVLFDKQNIRLYGRLCKTKVVRLKL